MLLKRLDSPIESGNDKKWLSGHDKKEKSFSALWSSQRAENPVNMKKSFYVYILASKRNGILYVGVTSDLIKRVWEHKNKLAEGFTEKYGVDKLVYYEQFRDAEYAIKREKRLKNYNRKWKLELIEKSNPDWKDLYENLGTGCPDQVGA